LFSFLFLWLPMLVIGVLLLIGFIMRNGGRSPFLEHGLTELCLGDCSTIFGTYIAIRTERVAAEHQRVRSRVAARLPRFAKPIMKVIVGEPTSHSSMDTPMLRLIGLGFALVGILLFIGGWERL